LDREKKEEKEFQENLDRLLKGEEVEDVEDASEDYLMAINFSKKLAEYHMEPSSAFKEQLRRQLLHKMAVREEEKRRKESTNSFWEGVRNLFAGSLTRRVAAVTTTAIVLTLVILTATGRFSPYTGPNGVGSDDDIRAFAPPIETALVLEAIPLQIVAVTGETIEIELMFRNTSPEAVELAAFPPAIDIRQAETKELVWSLSEGDEEREIQPLEALNYTIVWDQLDNNGSQVKPAQYVVFMSSITIYKGAERTESHVSFGLVANLVIQSP
jgi:hypothetical protein